MKTRKIKNLGEAQALYGRYTKEAENGGLIVRRCGGNFANLGRSNVIFHLANWDLPLTKSGAPYIQIEGLQIQSLIKDIYPGFSDKAKICFGTDVMRDTNRSTEMHFYVTMDVDQARYVLIADHQDVQCPHKVANEIERGALHYFPGHIRPERDGIDWECWDYYILPFYAVFRDGEASCTEIITEEGRKRRRNMAKSFLHKVFEDDMPPKAVGTSQEEKPKRLNPVERIHYDDGVYRIMSFVLDAYGRMLQPKMKDDKASSFIDATVACMDVWDIVPKDHLVVEYVQRGFSTDPTYKLVRCPVDKNDKPIAPTSLQLDRVAILEAQLTSARKTKATELGVSNILICGTPETWSRQLEKRMELAR